MKPMAFFYLLVVYVLLQFSWWAYLLIELNKEVYANKVEIVELTKEKGPLSVETKLRDDLNERWIMVAGEGVVFLGILLFGIYKTRSSFRKEFALAKQQKNFLLSVTHEFKSPLAAVKLNLQTLQKRTLSKDQQNQIISNAVNETDRINNLIENALLAARIESNSFQLGNEEINMSDCISSTIQNRMIPGHDHHTLSMNIEEGIYIKGDALAISSLILNLVENAEKYSPENSVIGVHLYENQGNAILEVSDTGYGVPDEEKKKIFEKFYRVGNEDTRRTKGTGLGLFIVKHIVELHNGEIKVENNHPGGSVFKVILPIEK